MIIKTKPLKESTPRIQITIRLGLCGLDRLISAVASDLAEPWGTTDPCGSCPLNETKYIYIQAVKLKAAEC